MARVTTTCPLCQNSRTIEVPEAGLQAWEQGALIQDAMPELSPSDREALMTGICDTCWDAQWGDE